MINKIRNLFKRNETHAVGFFAIHPAYMPSKKHASDAGYDIKAHTFIGIENCDITTDTTDDKELKQTIVISPGGRCLVNTGVWPMIESHDIEIQVRPRSGLALKHGISVVNSPGTVDSGYRDEIGVIIINHGRVPFTIKTGDRIAQLVICNLPTICVSVLENAPPRVDRVGGFGHTGVK